MKNLKKNNKGFSLVELIVVVLIMAIIAVALAPQIMKWVKNSRITADQNACGNLKTAVQAGIADFQAKGGNLDKTKDAKYSISDAAVVTVVSDDPQIDSSHTLKTYIDLAIGGETYKTKFDNGGFAITVKPNAGVTVTCGASTESLE